MIVLNTLAILLAVSLFAYSGVMESLYVATFLLCTQLAFLFPLYRRLVLVMMILNVCASCLGVIVLLVMMFGDAAGHAVIFSRINTLGLLAAFCLITLLNIRYLKAALHANAGLGRS